MKENRIHNKKVRFQENRMWQDSTEVVRKLKDYKYQLTSMDDRIRRYLSDRQRNKPPGHEALIAEIRDYESQIHHLKDREIQGWLDNLMHSLLIYERLWKQDIEADARNWSMRGYAPADPPGASEQDGVLQRVYDAVESRLNEITDGTAESRDAFFHRMLPQYVHARRHLKPGERIAFVYNREKHRVEMKVK
jgi:hypothetical protein